MVRTAQEHEAEDKKLREAIEKKNKLDGLIHDIEKTLKEHREKVGAEEAAKVDTALEAAKKTLQEQSEDGEALQKATDELLQASHKIAELLYKEKSAEEKTEGASEHADKQGPIDTDITE